MSAPFMAAAGPHVHAPDVSPHVDLPVIVIKDQRVVATEHLAKEFGTEPVRIQQNYANNKERFPEGTHCFKVEGRDLADLRLALGEAQISPKVRSMMFWTERGAFAHAKILGTDETWNVHERLVDTYFAVKAGRIEPTTAPSRVDLTNPDVLLPLLGQYAADKKLLLAQVEEMKPAVAALERLAVLTDGAMCITDAAKDLQMTRKDLIRFLEQNGWIYRRAGSRRRMVAYQSRIQAGHLEHKLQEVGDGQGGTKMAEQVMVTPRGRALLAKQLSAGGED